MAKILCRYSGILFQCEHMPIGLSANEYHHPLFSVPKKRLLNLAKEWAANRLTQTEAYLLYLSLLHSTDLIIWRSPARFTDKTTQIVANNMESLLNIIGKIDVIHHPNFALPRFAISYDTAGLENSFYWIQAWLHNYNEFMTDSLEASRREEIKHRVERRELSLEKLIKTAFSNPQTIANNLADWAANACDFPEFKISHPHTKQQTHISEYWQQIIRACAREEAIWKYPRHDLEELITHCEDHIEPGTIYATALMRLLRGGLKKHADYTGFGDVDLAGKTTTFKLLRASDTSEDANILAAVQSAPDVEPKKHMYPTLGAYIRAKMNWDLKMRITKSGESGEGE